MKRALIATALGGLLLVGTPTLALSAQRNESRAAKTADKGGDKGGDKGKSGDKGDRGDHRADHRGERGDHRGDRHDRDSRHRHGHRHGGYYDNYYYGYPYYGGGYYGGGYGDPYYYDRYGAGRDGTVLVRGLAFNPPEVNIRPGGHVTWQFNDRAPHTVTADNSSFDSGERGSGEFRLYFNEPGTYSYHCAIHPDMKGRVIVG